MAASSRDVKPLSARVDVGRGLLYLALTIALIVAMVPFIWAISASLKTNYQIFAEPFSLPKQPIWDNYRRAWTEGHFGVYFGNSVAIAIPTVIGSLACASLAGFAFARLHFYGNTVLFFLFLIGMAVPTNAILIPLYYTNLRLGLLDTLVGVILPATAGGMPFSIFLMRSFFRSLPEELVEAGRLDGCSDFGIFWWVMLPLSKGALTTLLIFRFMGSWNDFMLPFIFLHSESKRTLPLGLLFFQGRYLTDYGVLFAGITISFIPTLILYAIFQREYIRGLTVGSVKG